MNTIKKLLVTATVLGALAVPALASAQQQGGTKAPSAQVTARHLRARAHNGASRQRVARGAHVTPAVRTPAARRSR